MNTPLFIAVNGLVGALVGAATNELAIRWIFWKIIPGKRQQMTASIKTVISEELMAPEKVIAKINSDQVKTSIKTNINELILQILERDLPSLEELVRDQDVLDAFETRTRKILTRELLTKLTDRAFFESSLGPLVKDEVAVILRRSPSEIFTDLADYLAVVPEKIRSLLRNDSNRSYMSKAIGNVIYPFLMSDHCLVDLLPTNVQEDVTRVLLEQLPNLSEKVAAFVEKDEIQAKLRKNIRVALEQQVSAKTPELVKSVKSMFDSILNVNTGRLLSSALGLDKEIAKFCATLPDRIREEAAEEENQQEFRNIVEELAADFLKTKFADIFQFLEPDRLNQGCETIYTQILDDDTCLKIGGEIRDMLAKAFDKPLKENARMLHLPLDETKLADTLSDYLWQSLNSSQTEALINAKLTEFLHGLKQRRIGKLKRWLKPDIQERIDDLVTDFLVNTMAGRFEEFSEQSGLWDIITTSLDGYSDKEIELLVRKVANRELQWVTVMGGIIGLIIGTVQGFISLKLLT